ncbi:MAG: TetR family transcriptional regulator [bacterium]
MPTATFFNLPEEKRDKLVCAIKDEFSRVSFDKISINKIIQTAEIPRGSFYQYFTDKNDMLEYILLEYQKQMLRHIEEFLHINNGDIFSMFYNILEFAMEFTMEEKANRFGQNLFADIKVNTDFYLKMSKNTTGIEILKELQPLINFDVLDLREEDDFDNMLSVLFSICRDATAEVFLNISDCEKTKQKYKKQIQLLKRGFTKNKE